MAWIVNFAPEGGPVPSRPNMTLLDATRQIAVPGAALYAPCGGKGLCGRCRFSGLWKVLSLLPRIRSSNVLEQESLESRIPLACQTRPQSALRVEVPPESLVGQHILQVEGSRFVSPPIVVTAGRGAEPVISILPARFPRPIGLAVDLGTTKIACFLVDL